ncbi:hypothetical protein [Serratia sp. BIGb0163]|uniref:hypothetical protein n=1 Tax=Serratia sp. BIGb0163 TaxID=2940613 RepID=UPI00216927BA|nr:hypothetical protein [Serratia sp. BIGb0163]MCS4267304.1 hypothetical protein [Serratia sp. BIGb0163]
MKKYNTSSLRVSLLSVSSLCIMLAGSNVALAGNNSADITASVSVVSTDICGFQVSPADKSMQMTWTRETNGQGKVELKSSGEPVYITVRAEGGGNCNLNSIKLKTVVGPDMIPTITDDGITVFRVRTGAMGAFWRMLPLLADAKFYTDDATHTQGQGTITWDGPKSGESDAVTFGTAPKNHASDIGDGSAVGLGGYMFMTDEYVEDGGALLVDQAGNEGTFSSGASAETYKSAKLGFGALIATNPESVDGGPNPLLASGGDQFTFTWTIYIDQA